MLLPRNGHLPVSAGLKFAKFSQNCSDCSHVTEQYALMKGDVHSPTQNAIFQSTPLSAEETQACYQAWMNPIESQEKQTVCTSNWDAAQ